MVSLEPQLGGVVHRVEHLGLVVPVVRVGELDDLDVVPGHPVDAEHQLDALLLLDTPPVVLDGVQALGETDLLPAELGHPVDVVAGANEHAAALGRRVGRTQQLGPADVGVNVNRREESAEADQVVHVVDVVRIPVVLTARTEEGVLDAELLVLLTHPAELLVDVAGRDQGAVRVVHLAPGQRNGARDLLRHGVLRPGRTDRWAVRTPSCDEAAPRFLSTVVYIRVEGCARGLHVEPRTYVPCVVRAGGSAGEGHGVAPRRRAECTSSSRSSVSEVSLRFPASMRYASKIRHPRAVATI